MRRALEEAQDYGIRVHLWGVEAGAPEYNQSQSLIAEADRRWVIPAAWVQKYVRLRPSEPDIAPNLAAQQSGAAVREEVSTSTVLEPPAISPARSTVIPASPDDLARLRVAFEKGSPGLAVETEPGWTVTEAAHDDVPRLRDITTSAQAWRDNEDDATTPGRTPDDLGSNFGARWAARASSDQLSALLVLRPRTPRHLDGEMLRYANGLGVDTWDDEAAKSAVRGAFWRAVAEHQQESGS